MRARLRTQARAQQRATPRCALLLCVAGAALASSSCQRAERGPVELWFGGDVHLGAATNDVLGPLTPALKGAVGVVNLEGPVTTEAAESTAERLVNGPATIEALRRAGVRAVGVWNNHSLDLEGRGFAETVERLSDAGLLPFGGAGRVEVLEVRGVRIGLTQHLVGEKTGDVRLADIADARARADVAVASFHVVGPPSLLPSPAVRAAVEGALEAGARIVTVHGTHAIARVERRGDAVIAWGLGNLAFDCDCTDRREGLILRVQVDARGNLRHAEILPVDAGLHGAPARWSADKALALEQLEALESTPLTVTELGATF